MKAPSAAGTPWYDAPMSEVLTESPLIQERALPERATQRGPERLADRSVARIPHRFPGPAGSPLTGSPPTGRSAPAVATPAAPARLARWLRRESPRRVKVSTALRFYHEVVGLDHLHYGLWNGEELSLEGLKTAQDRFSRLLLSWVPSEVESILDVGCGTGATAHMLNASGLEVEGLSPDPYHETIFARRVGRPFHLSRFQEFRPQRRYDLVLMSESAQYIWLDRLFPAVADSARGGHLLVADYFTVNGHGGPTAKSGHPLEAFLAEADAAGLVLERREDITEQVLPTLDLARSWLECYVDPCLGLATDYLVRKRPWLARLGRRILRTRLRRLDELRKHVDSDEFRRTKRYLVLRFRIPD